MSWIRKLYDTYNNCQSMVGVESGSSSVPLLPVFHTTQMSHIEVVIDGKGNFKRAKVIPKDQARTIIPCTEESSGRTSGGAPHPLCDKLQYVAMDYIAWGGGKKPYSDSYISNLEKWCSSSFSHGKATAVLTYVKKGCLIKDLVDLHILITGEDGKLLKKWDKKKDKNVPEIFEQLKLQDDAFIRWVVEIPGDPEPRVWRDETLWQSWIDYYKSTLKEKSLCYVTGEEDFIANQHPAKLIGDGDKAKLISSNDSSGFTFRGRFEKADQAAAVGLEISQKAHYALRWLISRQGYRKGGMAIVAWATSGAETPQPTDSTLAMFGVDNLPVGNMPLHAAAQDVAIRLRKRIAGYGKEIGNTSDVVVMALNSATPGQGREAITYYQELTGSDFLKRIKDWHESCSWLHHYGMIEVQDEKTGKLKMRPVTFIGAPSPIDIAEAAYSERVDDRLMQLTISRILPCIIEGQQIPRDLVESCVRRACNRAGLKKQKDHREWEWNKALTIACALYRKYHRKENYGMALDLNRKTRDYLYGRLLALAESLEVWALEESGEKRETNAARLMQRFAEHPYSTWRTIELALAPYKARLGKRALKRLRLIDEVIASFEPDEFINDKRLSGEFLLGYHCQREDLRGHKDLEDKIEEN